MLFILNQDQGGIFAIYIFEKSRHVKEVGTEPLANQFKIKSHLF